MNKNFVKIFRINTYEETGLVELWNLSGKYAGKSGVMICAYNVSAWKMEAGGNRHLRSSSPIVESSRQA